MDETRDDGGAEYDNNRPMPNPSTDRFFTPIDQAMIRLDAILKSAMGPHNARRPYPADGIADTISDPDARKHIAGLMRINHAGEICAQALYHGQALTAKLDGVRHSMSQAAQEEVDHLSWCARRLQELNDRPSLLDPVWYAGSFAIGAVAGIAGDSNSLGFVAETEKQVVDHLQSHLDQLPQDDARTRAIIKQMIEDEAHHGGTALQQGGVLPPGPVKALMKLTARVMTSSSYWI